MIENKRRATGNTDWSIQWPSTISLSPARQSIDKEVREKRSVAATEVVMESRRR